MVPGAQFVFPGSLAPNAPDDMFSALGKNGQQINVVPSRGLVVIRMGNVPNGEGAAVAVLFNNDLWAHLNNLFCTSTAISGTPDPGTRVYPSPAADRLFIKTPLPVQQKAQVISSDGRLRDVIIETGSMDVSSLAPGSYVLRYSEVDGRAHVERFSIVR
ncbi:MAG TPA: hypothetical protein PK760_02500, partial [Flavobacteriales bacterium]|nr:hypothetical protein [Flavobacteriales bacterium]